jgi:hypothetical protein
MNGTLGLTPSSLPMKKSEVEVLAVGLPVVGGLDNRQRHSDLGTVSSLSNVAD